MVRKSDTERQAKRRAEMRDKPHRQKLAKEWKARGISFVEDPEAQADEVGREHERMAERGDVEV